MNMGVFALGFILGGLFGMGFMCIFQFKKEDDKKNDRT